MQRRRYRPERALRPPSGGVERPRRVVRFARLIHRRVRAFWPAFGRRRLRRYHIPPGLLLTVVGQQQPESEAIDRMVRLGFSRRAEVLPNLTSPPGCLAAAHLELQPRMPGRSRVGLQPCHSLPPQVRDLGLPGCSVASEGSSS
jgi:hypothetical protein